MLDYAHDAFANFHIDGSFNLEKFKKEFRVENFVARDGSEVRSDWVDDVLLPTHPPTQPHNPTIQPCLLFLSLIRSCSRTQDKCTFELIGVDAPIANALRRIMISRVPTMAIDIVR